MGADMTRSYLGKHVRRSQTPPEEIKGMAKAAWHKRNVLMVPLDDPELIIDDIHRQALINVGNKLYGERKG